MSEDGVDPTSIDRWCQALSWQVTLREADEKKLASSIGREWQDWCADAENRRVFDNVSRLLADRDLYGQPSRPGPAELDGDSYDLSVPINEWRTARVLQAGRRRRISRTRSLLSGGIGIAAIVALLAFWLRPLGFAGEPRRIVYQTEVGGLKEVHLTDGSSIILGGHTELSVSFSTRRRSVGITEGQAWFRVAHDQHWPFVVTAGNGVITDVGTAFLVTRESDRVVVTVTEGAVEVSTRQPMRRSSPFDTYFTVRLPAAAAIRVLSGEQLDFDDKGAPGPIRQADTRAATTWTQGRLTFDDQPLRYVIEAVNRYSLRHIAISPSAGALRFSGIVFDNEINDWLASLEGIFPVTVDARGVNVRIKMRLATPATVEVRRHGYRDTTKSH